MSEPQDAPPASTPDGGPPPKVLRRAIGASAIGNAAEWFDYGVYAYVATEIGANFFPGEYQTLSALLVFAVSFVLRPLGGVFWGAVGDRRGRRFVLTLTIFLVTAATVGIGLLPTAASVGVLAPILLVLLRMVQGFSTGGEYGGAATFMAEYAPDRRRGFYGSFLEVGTISGFTLAIVVVALTEQVVGSEAMAEWGWRIPFLVSAPLGLVGLYLRRRLQDTPVFRELEASDGLESSAGAGLRTLLREYRRPLLALGGLTIALNVANYTLLAYTPTYLQETLGMGSVSTDVLIAVGQAAMIVFLPLAGLASDRVGRKPVWWVSLVGLFVLVVPMYLLMAQGFVGAIIGFAVLGLVYVLQLGTISAMFPAMFPTHVRYAGFATSYNVATALFGGTAPAINEGLITVTGSNLVPAYTMMVAFVVGMIALRFTPETRGASLRGREVPRAVAAS
ncbi:MFS transporter [Actinomycetospora cinnamomea]|uniref:Putative proline/betaine transporter n=1 Tax=Actinomycetospora cinnamomea TaxID=663609 RepID=A0A2U1E9X2_9PSEU|nr:MFS transporter [Actinomycetospora cinnamomea]PVY96697.1 MHS family proline/betaine transporter-like MFS transporter [Actinomycetospora cinnamomea]